MNVNPQLHLDTAQRGEGKQSPSWGGGAETPPQHLRRARRPAEELVGKDGGVNKLTRGEGISRSL